MKNLTVAASILPNWKAFGQVSLVSVCLLLFVLLPEVAQSAPNGKARCSATIDLAAGRHARCLFKAEAHLLLREREASYEKAVAHCEAKFFSRFERAQQRHGAENCPPPTSEQFAEAVSQLADTITGVAASSDNFMLCPDGSGVRVSSLACVQAEAGASTWDSFTWYKQQEGLLSFADGFVGVQPGAISAKRLVLATTQAAADLVVDDVNGMRDTFGASPQTKVEVYVRPQYTKIPTEVGNGCDKTDCAVLPVQAWIKEMLDQFETASGVKPTGVACQQEDGWNPQNRAFKCPELMTALNGAYPFLQIESGYGCYKAPTGSPAQVHVVMASSDPDKTDVCTGPTVAGSCLCPTWHLLERTYEPYVIGSFKQLTSSAKGCKENENDYCCTYEDAVPGGTCHHGSSSAEAGTVPSCVLSGEPAASSYGKLVGLYWNANTAFQSPPGGNVPCLGVNYANESGNANCRVEVVDGPNSAASLLQQISAGASPSKDLCFY
jgi:hypothetical protein